MKLSAKRLLPAVVAFLAVAVAIALQLTIPALPRFLALLPAVLIAGFVGGQWIGGTTLIATTAFAIYDAAEGGVPRTDAAFLVALFCFLLSGSLALTLIELHGRALARLRRERQRLQIALRAAEAAVWEISPKGELEWDENFYRLVGLPPRPIPPNLAEFLKMVDPRDRSRMEHARHLMDAGQDPPPVDEYRLVRGDGETVWLENHRTRVWEGGQFFIGITQDITRRKVAEERVEALLHESEHRAKNLFAVILAIARETSRASDSLESFGSAFEARLLGLSRSHELLVKGNWRGTTLEALAVAHLAPFASIDRYDLVGPEIILTPSSAQYLGMAFHELATNASKYGAFSTAAGKVSLSWNVAEAENGPAICIEWREKSSQPPADSIAPHGFGTRVLMEIVPASLGGVSSRRAEAEGIVWNISAPLDGVAEMRAA